MVDKAGAKLFGFSRDDDEWLPVRVDSNGIIQVYDPSLWIPKAGHLETWQTLAIDPVMWGVVDPATGTVWRAASSGTNIVASAIPNANETARLYSNHWWVANPGLFDTDTMVQRLRFVFEARLTNVANLDNTLTILGGLTFGVADTRATNDIILFGLLADVLQTITDVGGVEEDNTGFGETLTDLNKFRIDIQSASQGLTGVAFYLNETLIASHVLSWPNMPMRLNFFCDTEAGGAATIEIGQVVILQEVKL